MGDMDVKGVKLQDRAKPKADGKAAEKPKLIENKAPEEAKFLKKAEEKPKQQVLIGEAQGWKVFVNQDRPDPEPQPVSSIRNQIVSTAFGFLKFGLPLILMMLCPPMGIMGSILMMGGLAAGLSVLEQTLIGGIFNLDFKKVAADGMAGIFAGACFGIAGGILKGAGLARGLFARILGRTPTATPTIGALVRSNPRTSGAISGGLIGFGSTLYNEIFKDFPPAADPAERERKAEERKAVMNSPGFMGRLALNTAIGAAGGYACGAMYSRFRSSTTVIHSPSASTRATNAATNLEYQISQYSSTSPYGPLPPPPGFFRSFTI